jgi:hypothetical protein
MRKKVGKHFNNPLSSWQIIALWRGADINAKIPPKAAWHMVCLPKSEGGLGVPNLTT